MRKRDRAYSRQWAEVHRDHKREKEKRLVSTPGTYKYNWAHGLGLPGIVKRASQRKNYRTQATQADINALRRLANGEG